MAHRISTITSCDRIIYLERGTDIASLGGGGARVAEQGTHAELLAMNGQYSRFVRQLNEETQSAAAATYVAAPPTSTLTGSDAGLRLDRQESLGSSTASVDTVVAELEAATTALQRFAHPSGGWTPRGDTVGDDAMTAGNVALRAAVSRLQSTLRKIESDVA